MFHVSLWNLGKCFRNRKKVFKPVGKQIIHFIKLESIKTRDQTNMNSSNSQSTTESSSNYTVIIPINPDAIIRNHLNPNEEVILMQKHEFDSSLFPNLEVGELPSNGTVSTPPPPGLSRNNNKQTNYDNNNSNGNGYINNELWEDSNPTRSCPIATATTTVNKSNFNSSDYSQSPFNPLAIMSLNEFDTPIVSARDENNEKLSLASNQFKLFVDETLKKVSGTDAAVPVKARLIIPANYSQSNKTRWGLKIFSPSPDLVQKAKMEIMRSPSLCIMNGEEDVDMETSLRTSKTIESLLFEEGDHHHQHQQEIIAQGADYPADHLTTIDFPVLASLSGPLLGPKYDVIKYALAEYNCTINWEGSLALRPINSSLNMHITGKDPKAVSSVIQMLKSRTDRIDEIPLAVTTLVIESGKLDWIYSSGAIKHVEDALWNTGATLTHLSDSVYQITCLSGALLSSCLKRLHVILSRYQILYFTFRYRNDFRDFSTKCSAVFESLAQTTDCVVNQRCINGGSVQVEIGGSAGDIARALIRLDTLRNQIFENGACDLKLIERRLRLHVPAEIREFISGKKDGKLNRIMKETGVNIYLNVIGGDSMYVDLISEDHMGANFGSNVLLHALRLIEGELPAEMTFHVPEVHHKRMIGHGGKVIQRIMKKWGVYVKFMGNQETLQVHQLSDPLTLNDRSDLNVLDNVIVRTPSKNASALKSIKEEIFEECCVSDVTGQFDRDSFNMLKKIQSSSKSRVSVTLPLSNRKYLPSLLKRINQFVTASLRTGSEVDVLILEGEKADLSDLITEMARELKSEVEFEGTGEEIIIKSPKLTETVAQSSNNHFNSYSSSSPPCLSDASFKCFPSALFVVQSQQSISASGSPLLQSDLLSSMSSSEMDFDFPSPVSSVAMNSLSSMNSSPPLPVGHQKNGSFKSTDEINFALAETKRRSADIF